MFILTGCQGYGRIPAYRQHGSRTFWELDDDLPGIDHPSGASRLFVFISQTDTELT
jgi:hypothetical protein